MNFRAFIFTCVISSTNFNCSSQKADSTSRGVNQKKVIPLGIGVGGIWAGGIAGLSSVWYNEFEKTSFHAFDDSRDWMQMDKVGHIYSAMHISEANYRLFKWSGLSDKTSAWVGAGIGFGFQTSLEILDGRNKEWGFSWADMAANTIGTAWFLVQEQIWKEQRLLLKFSYHTTEFAAYRPQVLGSTFSEKILKDYNGQTYWMSFSPKQFNTNWRFPDWLCFSFGYSVEEKLIGNKNIYVRGTQIFQARRQYLLSLDLDVRKLPIKIPWVKALLRPLHYVKIPFPALILDGNNLRGNWFYF